METFYSFACSAIGKNHLDCGTVLQDASTFYEDGRCSVIAVSDGHGSENFPRSDRGSKFACTAAVDAVREFLDGLEPAQLRPPAARDAAVIQLCKNILLRWNTAVMDDAGQNPFSEEEVAHVKEKYRAAYLAGERVVHAYGATLLLAILTPDFFLAIRNGDGECVAIDGEGELTAPIPGNDKNEASFVTSLCDEDAIEDFRYFYDETLPTAVMLGSDGVENSYVRLEDLFSLYRNICRKAAHEGGPATKEEVERALSIITARGSGDDVSIACCLDLPRLQTLAPVLDQAAAARQEQLAAEKASRQLRSLEQTAEAKCSQLQEELRTPKQRFPFSLLAFAAPRTSVPFPRPAEPAPLSLPISEDTVSMQAPPPANMDDDGFRSAEFPVVRRKELFNTAPVVKETEEAGPSDPADGADHPPL